MLAFFMFVILSGFFLSSGSGKVPAFKPLE